MYNNEKCQTFCGSYASFHSELNIFDYLHTEFRHKLSLSLSNEQQIVNIVPSLKKTSVSHIHVLFN